MIRLTKVKYYYLVNNTDGTPYAQYWRLRRDALRFAMKLETPANWDIIPQVTYELATIAEIVENANAQNS